MKFLRVILSTTLILALTAELLADQKRRRKKGEEEEITQTLEVLPDPPTAVAGETQRLGFITAAMSSKGLLSQQVRDVLRALKKQARGAGILRIRAFVAGSGDLRRVQSIVSEEFTDWKQPLPALTTVRVGALPQENAQVLLEAIVSEKKPTNPSGLAFLSGQQVTDKEPLEKVGGLLRKSVADLQTALRGIEAGDVLRVTCFVSSLGDHMEMRTQVATSFPKAAIALVQPLRGITTGLVECEAVARLNQPPAKPAVFVNPAGLQASANYSQVVMVNAPKLVLSGGQLAFRNQDADVRLALDRVGKAMEQAGGSLRSTLLTNYYPLAQSTIDKIRAIRFEFLDKSKPPASTMLLFEGLSSMDASFAVEMIALP